MKTENINTILFDLDGTLIEPKQRLYTLFAELTGSNITFDEYWEYKNKGFNQKQILKKVGYDSNMDDDFIGRWLANIERLDLLELDRVYDEVADVLKELKRDNIRMFIATNRQSYEGIERELCNFGIRDFFSGIISTFQNCKKEEAILSAGIDVSNAFFVGDSSEDMEAAKALGITGVLVNRVSYQNKAAIEADYYIKDLSELRGIILNFL